MQAAIGLVGVALGALLAPALDWARQSRRVREERRRELLEATAGFVTASGDALQAEWGTDSDQDAWKSGVGFRAAPPRKIPSSASERTEHPRGRFGSR
jgi:hypothetical protein